MKIVLETYIYIFINFYILYIKICQNVHVHVHVHANVPLNDLVPEKDGLVVVEPLFVCQRERTNGTRAKDPDVVLDRNLRVILILIVRGLEGQAVEPKVKRFISVQPYPLLCVQLVIIKHCFNIVNPHFLI